MTDGWPKPYKKILWGEAEVDTAAQVKHFGPSRCSLGTVKAIFVMSFTSRFVAVQWRLHVSPGVLSVHYPGGELRSTSCIGRCKEHRHRYFRGMSGKVPAFSHRLLVGPRHPVFRIFLSDYDIQILESKSGGCKPSPPLACVLFGSQSTRGNPAIES